ncbi:DUF1573 domain-containing protein [Candidatus Uabimicrobium amorphum]|uniref:DUF1573 domain-containing protein n=1 Tax=Uabimicrobium amorphum TaxID=2596890 RepID=A0A5S9IKK5_UABAM|nr:DUF1573 domain-containing protein [Candidatus Uabimicrobium amorphum]BBM83081.1 hypothetical protein UABAM_01431 [Candidatus Uabimicrobium amorphum]
MFRFILALFFVALVTAQDDLVISPETISLGKIPDNKKIDMVFTITNNSNSTVVIEKVETSCGCSSAYPTPSEVSPAGTSKIKANLDPRGKKGYSSWQIKVFTNSVNTPIVYASFDADVLQTGTVSHKFLSFGEFRRETTQKKQLWISPENNPDFKIIAIKQNIFDQQGEYFDIEVKDDVYAGFYPGKRPAKCIVLTTKKDIPYGRIDGELSIETNIPGYEKIKVAILARVAGDIGVRPDTISFGLLRDGKPKTRHAFIYHRNGESFTIKAMHSPWPELSITKEEMIKNQYYKIIVVCKPSKNMKAGEMRDHIVIETSDEKQTKIKIPLQGYVMSGKK